MSGIREVQYNFLEKMDCLIIKMDTDIKVNKRKRFLNKIKKDIIIKEEAEKE